MQNTTLTLSSFFSITTTLACIPFHVHSQLMDRFIPSKLMTSSLFKHSEESATTEKVRSSVFQEVVLGGDFIMSTSEENFTVKQIQTNFNFSGEKVIVEEIQATHGSTSRVVDVKSLLGVVEDILLQSSNPAAGSQASEDKTYPAEFTEMLESLAYTVEKICCEMSCKCSGSEDANATTMALLKTVSSYTWDAKVVLVLAAFAVNYGEFWLNAQLSTKNNQLAKSIALLKHWSKVSDESLRPGFEALRTLIKVMMELVSSIIDFTMIPAQYTNMPVNAPTVVYTAVYWTIASVLACSYQMKALIHSRQYQKELPVSEITKLTRIFAEKVVDINIELRAQIDHCHAHIDKKRHMEAYQKLVHLFENDHTDNMDILEGLICKRTDIEPLYDGSTTGMVNLRVLMKKKVLLLISNLYISSEEISMLVQKCKDPRSQYEVVWLPVLDQIVPWDLPRQIERFGILKTELKLCYSLNDLKFLQPWVIDYIKREWHFDKKPIVVALDEQGKVTHENATDMICIWGSLAFPLITRDAEKNLWIKHQNWELKLLVGDLINKNIMTSWVEKKELICFYGGQDTTWTEKFATLARSVSKTIKLVYIGKSEVKRKPKNTTEITYIWPDSTSISFFWARLESMWFSKMQYGPIVEKDHIMQEIMAILCYNSSDKNWALIADGSSGKMVKAKAETISISLTQIQQWKVRIDKGEQDFMTAFTCNLGQVAPPERECKRMILPWTTSNVKDIPCAECKLSMNKYIMYRCCCGTAMEGKYF